MWHHAAMTDTPAVTLPIDVQAHADHAIRALDRGMVPATDPHLSRVTGWLEGEALSRIVVWITDADCRIHATTLSDLIEGRRVDATDSDLLTPAEIIALLRLRLSQILEGELLGEEDPFRLVVPMRGSDGSHGFLGLKFRRFDQPVVWDGLFGSRGEYLAWLGGQGMLETLERFDRLAPMSILSAWHHTR